MPIPDFQALFLPYLQFLSNGEPHNTSEAEEYLAGIFKISDEQRKEQIPSGKAYRFRNRIAWVIAHFKQAQLVELVSRGIYKITTRGLELLAEKPKTLNVKSLKRYPDYQAWRTPKAGEPATGVTEDEQAGQTPLEILEGTYQTLSNTLARELLDKVKTCTPMFFEQLVVDLLVAMGYGGSRTEAGSRIGKSGDGGIDGIIKEDRLGLDAIYIQAKRWEATVGRPVVQAFAGSLEGVRARKGVLITTSTFSNEAIDYVSRIEKKIVLIGGDELSQLMIEHNIGISEAQRYTIKKIDMDYFSEE